MRFWASFKILSKQENQKRKICFDNKKADAAKSWVLGRAMMIYSGGELSVGRLPFFATCAELNEGGGQSTLEHNNTSWFQFWRACRIYSSMKWKVHNLGDITISYFFIVMKAL